MNLTFQCPGCFSVSRQPIEPEHVYYECDCGEKLTCIDLRDMGSELWDYVVYGRYPHCDCCEYKKLKVRDRG